MCLQANTYGMTGIMTIPPVNVHSLSHFQCQMSNKKFGPEGAGPQGGKSEKLSRMF